MTDESAEPDGTEADERAAAERAAELEEMERRLGERERSLELREETLNDRDATLGEREAAVEERETTLRERQEELEAWAAKLDRREATLEEYVGEQLTDVEAALSSTVEESVRSAVAELDAGQRPNRLGRVGNLVLALVGLLLVTAGVANAIAAQTPGMVRLFSSVTLNFAATGVLVVLGLAANLAGVTGRV